MTKKKLHVEPLEKWKFKRTRNGDEHAQNCESGYVKPKGQKPNVLEIHHILCVHACSDPKNFSKDDKIFIHVCLSHTDWNINSAKNNIGLPRKWAYVEDPENTTGWSGVPCHQVDHPRYLSAVMSWMTENVWNQMKSAEEAKQCEYLEGKNVAELFDKGSEEWKSFLNQRGQMHGGTKASLDYCLNRTVSGGLNDDNWHIPFSMEPDEKAIPRRNKPKEQKLVRSGLLSMIK